MVFVPFVRGILLWLIRFIDHEFIIEPFGNFIYLPPKIE